LKLKNKTVHNLAKNFGRENFEIITLKNVISWPIFTNFKQFFVNFLFENSTAVVSYRRRIDASAQILQMQCNPNESLNLTREWKEME